MDLITGIAFPNAKESKLNKVETTKVTSTGTRGCTGRRHHFES